MTRLHYVLIGALCLWAGAATSASGAAPPPQPKRMIVVAPRAFQPALESFVTHKQKLLPVEFFALEDIVSRYEGGDAPEKLKRFLFQEWRTRRLGYVLLVGDVDTVPVRYMVLDRVTKPAFDYAFYPSDLYYSDLAKADGSFEDWNARKEDFHAGYFGEVRGEKNKTDPLNYDEIDFRPDIAVGRWPVSTPEQARTVAAKTLSYESAVLAGRTPALHKAALLAVGGWVDSRDLLNRLAAKLTTSAWHVEKRYYADGGQDAATLPPDRDQVRALFNQGLGLVIHTGHGQPDSWEKCFSARDLARLTNSNALPVVISAGCSTAYFAPLAPYDGYIDIAGQKHVGTDHGEIFTSPPPPPSPFQRDEFNPTGLGEEFLKHRSGGAVAYLGCNTGSQPCGLTLVDGFVRALAQSTTPRLGDCWAEAVRYYHDHERLAALKPTTDWYPPSIFFQPMKFMLFGDPSLALPGKVD